MLSKNKIFEFSSSEFTNENAREHFNSALDDCKKNDWDSARKKLDQAIELEPVSDAYFLRGECYSQLSDLKNAAHNYEKTIEMNHNSNAYFKLIDAYLAQSKQEEALIACEQMLENKAIDSFEGDEIFKISILAGNLALSLRNYSKSKELIDLAFDCGDDEQSLHKGIYLRLVDSSEDLERKKQELKEKEREMLSFFTHTMRNALATAPEALRQAIHLLGSDVYEKDANHYKAINKIASLFSSLSLTDCLIDTFKQSISDPQEFKQAWNNDHIGDATPKWAIASALRQSLNRIIFMSDASDFKKLLKQPETALIKATRKSFIDEVLPLNVDAQGVDRFYEWVEQHVICIEVALSGTDDLHFGANQTRFSLLFAIVSELILNALKYWDGTDNICISWQSLDGCYVFSVKNHCQSNAVSRLAGTHKGLAFIKRLTELLDGHAQFNCNVEDQYFTAGLTLNKALFYGES